MSAYKPQFSAESAPAPGSPAAAQVSPISTAPADARDPDAIAERYRRIRARSVALAAPLSAEDAMVQSMADTSPTKWHLAHTTWFFERFVLAQSDRYQPVDSAWDVLFNSYYQSVGPMHARPQRGLLSRPSLAEVLDYRAQIDERIAHRFSAGDLDQQALRRITLGTHHEQQHQELLLTDIKHALWCNPLRPAYRDDLPDPRGSHSRQGWVEFDESIIHMGAPPWTETDSDTQAKPDAAPAGFAFDSESPRHRVLVPAHSLADRPVSNAEFRAFIDDGGYRNPALWMSEGWARIGAEQWERPLYWEQDGERAFTLSGLREIDPHAPVCHLSYFEADAFARWAGARLPTEAEWEQAAAMQPVAGHFADDDVLQPQAPSAASGEPSGPRQLFGDVWEWTSTAYMAYPGFRSLPGSLGEYNGKFMCGQWVLRGGSCATPRDHIRATYRNFFYPPDRWQFSGLRLARDPA
ncbi:MAG: ergothioneine biosynthesis protein EgtB [Lysobacter sp.]|nr:ergothioneine biosynthesis protein EgtB [Lysobacter sp.]